MSVYIGSRKKIKLSNELGNLLTLISEILKKRRLRINNFNTKIMIHY
ncbi:hypothetical protein CCAN12_380010 [Capnocytophaga canimorsus]|uniref:Uncharacterized protein n=1 Tax=Capnocytophaga canimorsus TaxID=28188 RepID=A0A0B7H412_9FLAO|nr:hypothetical protein CCAN12_380010 [Capnocytophaga canimorsus]